MASRDQIPISVCVIAQNEEGNLPDCLGSVDFAQERLVLDGGSTDRTREIAEEWGAIVAERPFDGWVSQKNAALELAASDWVLALDADERVSPELRASLIALFQAEGGPQADGYRLARRAWHLGRWIRGGGWYPDHKLRLFRRSRARWAGKDPHDYVQLEGSVETLSGDLLHYPYRDLAHHVAKMERYTTAAAQALFRQRRKHPILRMVFAPPLRFFKAYFLRGGIRDGWAGFVLAGMAAVYEFVRYAKLWELYREAAREGKA